jgi:hypothetical protein
LHDLAAFRNVRYSSSRGSKSDLQAAAWSSRQETGYNGLPARLAGRPASKAGPRRRALAEALAKQVAGRRYGARIHGAARDIAQAAISSSIEVVVRRD